MANQLNRTGTRGFRMNAAWAAVIGGIVATIGNIVVAWISKPGPPPKPDLNPPVASVPVGPAANAGIWIKDLQSKVAYRAETNGFVSAYTGGDKPAAGADILTGPRADKLETRTRAGGKYDGAAIPVRRDEYWMVNPQSPGTVVVQWLPTP